MCRADDVSERFEEPTLPTLPRAVRRVLVAVWISLGLHAAVIALVQVASPTTGGAGEPVIEVRLMPAAEPTPAHGAAPAPVPADAPATVAQEPVSDKPVSDEPAVTQPPASDAPCSSARAEAAPAATAPLTMDSAVDLTYYTARELDVQPRALQDIQPTYPPEAERQRQSGTVRLELKIEADGRVSDVAVVSADPPDVFDESARAAFAAARFSPAQKSGRPVRTRMLVEVSYVRDQGLAPGP